MKYKFNNSFLHYVKIWEKERISRYGISKMSRSMPSIIVEKLDERIYWKIGDRVTSKI